LFYKNLLSNHAYFSYIAVSHCKNYIMKFRKFLKQWLGYSRRERAGSMVLLLILVMVLVVRTVRTNDTLLDNKVEAKVKVKAKAKAKNEVPISMERIWNPRQVNDERNGLYDPERLGLQPSQGYRSELNEATKRGLQNHLIDTSQIHASGDTTPLSANADIPHWISRTPLHSGLKGEPIDINRADSATLEALPGIGPVLSVRIIKYRYLLGYYYRIDQLNDVYGLDEGVIEMNRYRFTCDSTMVRKININTAAYPDLLRHPYINRSQVEAIISHRRLSGSFADISELIRNRIFNSDELIRLEPYLKLK